MKLLKFSVLILALCLSLSSCDAVRSMLGKPTSKDLEIMRLQQEVLRAQSSLDSIAAAQARTERVADGQEAARNKVAARYYVAVGGFKVPENAVNYKAYLERQGYEITDVRFKTGYDVLLMAGSDNYYNVLHSMQDFIKNEKTCAWDIWIYDTETKIHE